ncbi:MAG: benzoate-CoA ligase family protein [Acidobacteriaceae bacterium]|nr:benzoate-CoA ligase family protein [Acidobacteriaceae bacterium]
MSLNSQPPAPAVNLPHEFNVASHFVDRNVREGRGAKVAIEYGDERVTYAQLLERTNRVGNALKQLGVRPEERVQLLIVDRPEFLYSFFGVIKIGAVAVPTNTLLQCDEYEYLLNDTRARVAIVSDSVLPRIEALRRERLRYLREIVVVEQPADDKSSFTRLINNGGPELEAEPTCKDDAAFWLYSSGSTGAPKGCIHLHHDMVVSSEHYARAILNISEDDRCYSVARLFFAYGLGNAGYFPLHVGATTILSPIAPTPANILATIERHRPTLFFSVPTNYAALLAHEREDGREFDLSSVRHGISAGEALPASVWERFKQRFGVEILDAMGSTEMLQMVMSNRPGKVRPGSSGQLLPGFEAKIVDDQGHTVATGEMGTLMVKADSTCAGYWNQHEKTKSTFEGHWIRTGDKYYQDEDGYFWYAGRGDDLFKVSGSWLSPVEVESVLVTHPAVLEAAVVARADENCLDRPAAFVVLNSDARPGEHLAQELQNWVAHRLAGYKKPAWVEFVPELPKTATGKVQRYKLREMARKAGMQSAASESG